MSKKFGLGKGLGALIPDEEIVEEKNSIDLIDINRIKPNSKQPRKNFDEEKISNLAKSIKDNGIIQPLVLKESGNDYEIIAGERRWRAAKLAGIKSIPAVIMELTDQKVLEVSLIENIQREDLNPIEEALAFKRLIKEFSITQEEVSKVIGRSRTAITNTMRLLNLDKRVQQYLIEGVISEGHGRALLSLDNKDTQYEMAIRVIDNKLSVRETERLVRDILNPKVKESIVEEENIYIKELQSRISEHFGTKVSIKTKKDNKGKIEIEYYSPEELDRILELLM
ncbi:Stage 0 sporulation protein J [Clostridium bornimense]|uniref:Stage 0 sporulation protein J n=1 Tax=Clostridium bornimense TaxID=1216932 RepID=W6S619_9CLOT|nr:ParB/RepB/Spo0J family partition protein [Clostridium bornimense]CDM69802.1 Stage 0 sporulation protein J [Clostridium bornimense]